MIGLSWPFPPQPFTAGLPNCRHLTCQITHVAYHDGPQLSYTHKLFFTADLRINVNISRSAKPMLHIFGMAEPLVTPQWVSSYQRGDHPQGQGRGGIACPHSLMELADLNGKMVKDTVSNGDCLFGAFAISASKFIESWP